MNLTLPLVRDTFNACYDSDRLARLYDREVTPLEVATRTDGEWSTVPANDRIWTLTSPGVLPDRTLRIFACWCATTALNNEEAHGRKVDPRSREAVRVTLLFADGKATREEMDAAYAAADTARAAAYAAADTARAAAYAAAYAAADTARAAALAAAYAAAYAARDAASAAALAAAYAASAAALAVREVAYAFQDKALAHLITLIEKESL